MHAGSARQARFFAAIGKPMREAVGMKWAAQASHQESQMLSIRSTLAGPFVAS